MPQDDDVATLSRVTQLREPWSERAVAKSGKPQAPQMGRDHISVAKPFLRSRGPSGLPRSGKSGKNSSSTSVETTGHLSVRALTTVPSDGGACCFPGVT